MMNDYMNRSPILSFADSELKYLIVEAKTHLEQAQHYKVMASVADPDDWNAVSDLYNSLVAGFMSAARIVVNDLENEGYISIHDWLVINHWLCWFGVPAEDRPDD